MNRVTAAELLEIGVPLICLNFCAFMERFFHVVFQLFACNANHFFVENRLAIHFAEHT